MCKKILSATANIMGALSMLSLVALITVNAFEIVMRLVLKRSNLWIQDLTTLLMVWFVFPGILKVVWEKKDIWVDLFVNALPFRAKKIVSILSSLIILLFSTAMCFSTFNYLRLVSGAKSVTAEIPLFLYTGMLFIGFIILFLMYVYFLIEQIKKTEKIKGEA
jgi:TRAP-type C4-dicarboxylate transport system permease small subunit